ncbi:MAG: pyrimidine/purine nucleoside phosphorylase, partial [Plesiomonas sp.]
DGETEWATFAAGEQFAVAGNSAFDLVVEQDSAYLCLFG